MAAPSAALTPVVAPVAAASARSGPDASSLVKPAEVASWLPASSAIGPLSGTPRSATYDAIRWGVSGSRDLGLTVQWWRFPSQAEAEGRFDKNLAGAPGAQSGTEVGSRSFRALGYHLRELCFVDPSTHSVVELGCGEATCSGDPGAGRLLELAKPIRTRLGGTTD